jgi:DNA-binding response OmpR family regulator
MANHVPVVLLIECDRSTRDLYYRELKSSFNVLACSSEIEALTLLENHPIEIVVLEPVMPEGQGWAFLALLCTKIQTKSIPVIVCSSLSERRKGLELGAVAYLVKPVLPAELSEAIKQVAGSRQLK